MTSQLPAMCWVIHDGAAGNRRQAMALAEFLGLPIREWALKPSGLAKLLAPRKFPGSAAGFGSEFASALRHEPPTLVIGCGRIAALATRQAKASGARSVQILDPRISPVHWDLVIVPEHDGLGGSNVLTMVGSLNPVGAGWLDRARQQFPQLGALARPRTAVLLGGQTRATRFDRDALEGLLDRLDSWLHRDGGSALICASRRTPAEWAGPIRDRYGSQGQLVWMDQGDGDNPYPGILAWADRIIVSPDSVNMISEACATAVPVFVAAPERATGRIQKFIQSLLRLGRVRAQGHDCEPFDTVPLDETRRIAAQMRERLSLR
jgi:mitochondrial fission protein ELM1